MIFEKYNYRYALIPHAEAKKMGLGWRKADQSGMVMMNLSELKQMPGEGSIEEKVEAVGGHIMSPDEAFYYRHTNTFGFVPDTKPQEQEQSAPQHPDSGTDTEEVDPGFTQSGTQTELPPDTDSGTEEIDPGFSQQPLSPEEVEQLEQQSKPASETEDLLSQKHKEQEKL